ncbi:hypothetical protein PY650_28015 [Rhizobium calliandrae]|uniref:Nodulation protein n=1 Tax=Rhizobium calliandrae TaxID=1312182 RepID=A0ABT7KL94_9HYPH|nr:hypothetical protein [Rhizobium calliandrae]MDL2409409.1 hypothetical protein [Rhizobium calliandrae]
MGSTNLQEGVARRGLWRLMLRLPAMRGRLQILGAKSSALQDLFEAYEDASVTLERLLREPDGAAPQMIREYETICSEVENEVIEYCRGHSPDPTV